jgi:hypothetical protein
MYVIGKKVFTAFLILLYAIHLKLVCHGNILYGNLKSKNSQDYAQKPHRNSSFMNSASVQNMEHIKMEAGTPA